MPTLVLVFCWKSFWIYSKLVADSYRPRFPRWVTLSKIVCFSRMEMRCTTCASLSVSYALKTKIFPDPLAPGVTSSTYHARGSSHYSAYSCNSCAPCDGFEHKEGSQLCRSQAHDTKLVSSEGVATGYQGALDLHHGFSCRPRALRAKREYKVCHERVRIIICSYMQFFATIDRITFSCSETDITSRTNDDNQ